MWPWDKPSSTTSWHAKPSGPKPSPSGSEPLSKPSQIRSNRVGTWRQAKKAEAWYCARSMKRFTPMKSEPWTLLEVLFSRKERHPSDFLWSDQNVERPALRANPRQLDDYFAFSPFNAKIDVPNAEAVTPGCGSDGSGETLLRHLSSDYPVACSQHGEVPSSLKAQKRPRKSLASPILNDNENHIPLSNSCLLRRHQISRRPFP